MRIKTLFRSIRWRLVASYVLLTLLTVSLTGILALSLVKRYVEQQEIRYLTANAEAIAQQAMPLLWPRQHDLALVDLAQTSAFLGNVRVRILDKDKQIISESGTQAEMSNYMLITPFGDAGQESEEQRTVRFMVLPERGKPAVLFFSRERDLSTRFSNQPVTIIRRIDEIWGRRLVFEGLPGNVQPLPHVDVADDVDQIEIQSNDLPPTEETVAETISEAKHVVTVPVGDENEPLGYVELSGGPSFAAEAVATTRRAFLWAAGGVVLLAVLVGLVVSRGLTAPLRSLADAANQMSSGDLSIRAPVRSQGEIGQLARQFNQMAERLEASFVELAAERDTLRRFIADASHELRTPITALRNFNELLQGAAAQDPAARQEFLTESQTQIKRLEWITSNLLNLSRLEAGLVMLDIAAHDVADVLSAISAAFKTTAQEKGIDLALNCPESALELRCDRARLELALSNLLDNALKFTPPGGKVELGATRSDRMTRIWVKDSGPGIPEADLARIFERFYRGRNTQNVAGSGLGLAISQRTIEAHSGQITVESQAGSGSCFTIALPG